MKRHVVCSGRPATQATQGFVGCGKSLDSVPGAVEE